MYDEYNKLFDFYPRINGKMTTLKEATLLLHYFRLTLNKLTLTRHSVNPVNIYSGAIYCFVENIGKITRWTDDRKWSFSKNKSVFLEYDELNGKLTKRTITIGFGRHRYHLINYFNKNDKSIKKIMDDNTIRIIEKSLKINRFLSLDPLLKNNLIGIDFFYNRNGINMKRMRKYFGTEKPVDSYFIQLKKFLKKYQIARSLTLNDLTEIEKDAVYILLGLSKDNSKRKK